ncbi:MAG: alpha/beta hydrolase [Burkholderiales bacterium]|jgi:pimeloyl-ACP methyl ester carboxylesterase|nr:alpha/beta hydrolase [Burkholderiales bacterium]
MKSRQKTGGIIKTCKRGANVTRLFGVVLCVISLAGCADRDRAGSLQFTPCRMTTLATEVSCATLNVPKKRGAESTPDTLKNNTISLRVIRLPANAPVAEPDPFFVIPGGPGQSAEAIAPLMVAMTEIRKKRDIIMIDPRGTGASAPISCPSLANDHASNRSLNILETAARVTHCLEELRADHIDPLDYGTLSSVEDIEDTRRALNVEKINIWAGSYGTRVALEYLRRYAQNTRTLTLDSVVSPSSTILLDGWQSRATQLRFWLEACEADPTCNKAIDDPSRVLSRLLKRLPRERTVTVVDPKTGKPQIIAIDFESALAAVLPLLYLPDYAALTPYILSRAADYHDFSPLITAANAFSSSLEKDVNPALYYAVTCAEDIRPRALPSTTLFTDALRRQSFFACSSWPKMRATETWGLPVTNTQTPVLILTGDLDPVTPPDLAREVGKTLTQKKIIVARGTGHIVSTQSCAPALIASFVNSGSLSRLLGSCVTHLEEGSLPDVWSNNLGASTAIQEENKHD